MFLTKPILTRSEPLKPHRVPLSEFNSSNPLINLIKKDQKNVVAQQPSTTNKNATQGIYIKDIKWLGQSL